MVGRALLIGRGVAMAEAGKNTPQGKGYATAFGTWLRTTALPWTKATAPG